MIFCLDRSGRVQTTLREKEDAGAARGRPWPGRVDTVKRIPFRRQLSNTASSTSS